MEALQKVDHEFGVGKRSGKHTIRDSNHDIRKMAAHLLEKQVTTRQDTRTFPPFRDTVEEGFTKMTQVWLKEALRHGEGILEQQQ